jgi:hypothetical protein
MVSTAKAARHFAIPFRSNGGNFMSRNDFGKVITNFVILIMLVIITAMGQSRKKTITHSQWRNQPVKCVKVKAAGQSFNFNATINTLHATFEHYEAFDGDDDWLKGLVVHLKNTSNKNIIYINLHLSFPETDVGGPRMSQPMEFGRYPEKPNVGSNDKVLKPGEEIEIALTDDDHAQLYDFLRSRNFHHLNDLRLALQFVVFEDDIMWLGGALMKRDPFNSASWVNINKQ